MAIKLALDDPERVSRLVLMAPGGLEEREAYMKMEGIRTMMKAFLAPGGITRERLRDGLRAAALRPSAHHRRDPRASADEIAEHAAEARADDACRCRTSPPSCRQLQLPGLRALGHGRQFCPVERRDDDREGVQARARPAPVRVRSLGDGRERGALQPTLASTSCRKRARRTCSESRPQTDRARRRALRRAARAAHRRRRSPSA